MNPLSRLQNWWNERRLASRLGVSRRSIFGHAGVAPAAPVLSGTWVTPETAMSLTAVYAAVNVVSRDCAIMPRNVYRRLKGGGRIVAPEQPAHNIVRWQASDNVNSLRFFQTMMSHVLTRGNGYAEIVRDLGDGSPQKLLILHPTKTEPKETKSGTLYYELDGDPNNRLPAEDVLHFAGMGFNGVKGFSPITIARQTIGLSIAAEQFGAAFFGNGAIPKGILKHPKRLTEIAAGNLRGTFYDKHQGSQNAHNLAVLEEGMDWVNTQISPEDSQFLQTRQFQIQDIARLFSVPPSKIGDYSNSHLRNIEEANLDYIATTLHGWIAMMEYELNIKLLTPKDRKRYSISFDMSALMRGDSAGRATYYQTMRNLGAISADEIRDMEGLNPIGPARGGDLYIVQGQYLPLDQISKIPDPSGPPVDEDPSDDGVDG